MSRRELDFELNLLPMISMLAVLICFLLLTAVWVQVGSLDVGQAFGENNGKSVGEKDPAVWATLQPRGDLDLEFKNISGWQNRMRIAGRNGQINWKAFDSLMGQVSQRRLRLQTALVMPDRSTQYQDVIELMDKFKQARIPQVGVAPL